MKTLLALGLALSSASSFAVPDLKCWDTIRPDNESVLFAVVRGPRLLDDISVREAAGATWEVEGLTSRYFADTISFNFTLGEGAYTLVLPADFATPDERPQINGILRSDVGGRRLSIGLTCRTDD